MQPEKTFTLTRREFIETLTLTGGEQRTDLVVEQRLLLFEILATTGHHVEHDGMTPRSVLLDHTIDCPPLLVIQPEPPRHGHHWPLGATAEPTPRHLAPLHSVPSGNDATTSDHAKSEHSQKDPNRLPLWMLH
jgi:hypothetical protein